MYKIKWLTAILSNTKWFLNADKEFGTKLKTLQR